MTVRAIYENGVFRPVEPLTLPEHLEVEVVLPSEKTQQEEIFAILRTTIPSGETDVAERHNEHQP